jgi:RNA polymerase sigma-54 factor
MSQKLVQSQSMQQVQTLSPQQVLQVRLLEMPVSELEQRVKNELIDNGALEESLGSPEDADTSSEDVYDGTDAESAGIETSGLDGGLPSDEYRPAEVRQAIIGLRTMCRIICCRNGEGKTVRKRWTMATRHLSTSR